MARARNWPSQCSAQQPLRMQLMPTHRVRVRAGCPVMRVALAAGQHLPAQQQQPGSGAVGRRWGVRSTGGGQGQHAVRTACARRKPHAAPRGRAGAHMRLRPCKPASPYRSPHALAVHAELVLLVQWVVVGIRIGQGRLCRAAAPAGSIAILHPRCGPRKAGDAQPATILFVDLCGRAPTRSSCGYVCCGCVCTLDVQFASICCAGAGACTQDVKEGGWEARCGRTAPWLGRAQQPERACKPPQAHHPPQRTRAMSHRRITLLRGHVPRWDRSSKAGRAKKNEPGHKHSSNSITSRPTIFGNHHTCYKCYKSSNIHNVSSRTSYKGGTHSLAKLCN